MPELENDLLNRLMFVLMKQDVPDLDGIRNKFVVILSDYRVEPKEEALAVWTEGKNEHYLKRFLLAKAVAGCTKSTLRHYNNEIKKALDAIGKDADVITATDVQVFLATIMQRSSKVYANTVRLALSSFYSWLTREELIPKNPMQKVDRVKTSKKKKPAFTDYEVELIRSGCKTNMERAMVEMLLSTGCRVSELTHIRIEDIEGNTINILGKGEKYRNVYLNAKAQLAVKQYLEERKDSIPYLFPKSVGATCNRKIQSVRWDWYKHPELVVDGVRDNGSIESTFRQIGKRVGVENVHPHRFRRTCATFALRRGMPIEQVSKMLGHASIATTQIYLDLSEEDLAQAHSKYVV